MTDDEFRRRVEALVDGNALGDGLRYQRHAEALEKASHVGDEKAAIVAIEAWADDLEREFDNSARLLRHTRTDDAQDELLAAGIPVFFFAFSAAPWRSDRPSQILRGFVDSVCEPTLLRLAAEHEVGTAAVCANILGGLAASFGLADLAVDLTARGLELIRGTGQGQ